MRNHVHLIAYADRFGGSISAMTEVLRSRFSGAFGGIHVLPFFAQFDGADAGFDPVDHTKVDPRLGSWADIQELAGSHDVMADLIVNHISSESPQFIDVRARGEASPWADLFLTMSSVFPAGAREAELSQIYRPRPGLPFTLVQLGGEPRLAWTTFTSQQIDIDVRSEQGRAYLARVLEALTSNGVSLIRLDAIGYAVKSPGTTCFMTPETYAFIGSLAEEARAHGAETLVEIHSYYARQIEIARHVDLVYDFALPPLVLHALYTGDGAELVRWLEIRPENAITVLDTHDGIGVVDVGPDQAPGNSPGLLTLQQIEDLVEGIHLRTGGASREATGESASNLDLYQVNATYYDALGRDDLRYLAARVIQFFTPGVPQVYYVGALAGSCDLELLRRTGVGRDINRHRYTLDEIDAELGRPVVRALVALCRFRSNLPAFDGPIDATFVGTRLTLRRVGRARPDVQATAVVDLATGATSISWTDAAGRHSTDDVLAHPPRTRDGE